jgi:hypothetical protein
MSGKADLIALAAGNNWVAKPFRQDNCGHVT